MITTCYACGKTDTDSWGVCIHCGTPFEDDNERYNDMNVIVVGRHTPELPEGINVVSQENILWSTDRQECVAQLEALIGQAKRKRAYILLQNVPGILAAALLDEQAKAGGHLPADIGVIISVPGPRESGVTRSFISSYDSEMAEAAKFLNPRAKIQQRGSSVHITLDPVSRFEFSHIEWL